MSDSQPACPGSLPERLAHSRRPFYPPGQTGRLCHPGYTPGPSPPGRLVPPGRADGMEKPGDWSGFRRVGVSSEVACGGGCGGWPQGSLCLFPGRDCPEPSGTWPRVHNALISPLGLLSPKPAPSPLLLLSAEGPPPAQEVGTAWDFPRQPSPRPRRSITARLPTVPANQAVSLRPALPFSPLLSFRQRYATHLPAGLPVSGPPLSSHPMISCKNHSFIRSFNKHVWSDSYVPALGEQESPPWVL